MHPPQPQWALPRPVTTPVEPHLSTGKIKSLCGPAGATHLSTLFVPVPTPVSGTHCGCSLYSVPSTPTVTLKCWRPWSSLLFSTMAAMPAPHIWAALRDTAPHTSFTTMLSSHVLSRPSCCRILLTCRRASRSLWTSRPERQQLLPAPGPASRDPESCRLAVP